MKACATRSARRRKPGCARGSEEAMGKTWKEELSGSKPQHTWVLEGLFAGIKSAVTVFVPTPLLLHNYMQAIPYGERRSIAHMLAELPARHGAAASCPMTASQFSLIAAEAAL